MNSKIVDWLSKLNAEDSLEKLEVNWHGAWGAFGRWRLEVGGKNKIVPFSLFQLIN